MYILQFIVIVLLITGSWFFKYPDVIPSEIVVTTENPPAVIVARSTGKINHLVVSDKQRVEQGQMLAVIENPGDYRDILKLETLLEGFGDSIQAGHIETGWTDDNYQMGEVQPEYSLFLKRFEDYEHFIDLDYHRQKINSLKEELKQARQRSLQKKPVYWSEL